MSPLLERLTIRTALVVGFGVTAALWAIAGLYFAHRTQALAVEAQAINARYLQAQELLSTVRAQVFLTSIYLRDALLDPDLGAAEMYRQQISDAYNAADAALRQYRPLVDSAAETEQVEQLVREIGEFNATLLGVLNAENRRDLVQARDVLRQLITPKRELVLRISEDARSVNRTAFLQQQEGIAKLHTETERGVWLVFGAALIVSIGIGLAATRHASRLELLIRGQALADLQKSNDLQRLSAQLVNAQEDERRRIARDLHDDIGQTLTAVKVELARGQRIITRLDGPPDALDEAKRIADHALRSVRDMSHLIHPELLDDFGLPDAIAAHLRTFMEDYGVQAELSSDRMETRFDSGIERAVYRIVQEALTNVAKHAGARNCRVYLQRLPNTLLVTIEDDGRGFEPASKASGKRGLGLIAIRERVDQLRGSLRLESQPGNGTRLTVELPAIERQTAETEAARLGPAQASTSADRKTT